MTRDYDVLVMDGRFDLLKVKGICVKVRNIGGPKTNKIGEVDITRMGIGSKIDSLRWMVQRFYVSLRMKKDIGEIP